MSSNVPGPPAAGVDIAQEGPPHGIDLITYAAISADIAEGDRAADEVLGARGLTAEQWAEVTRVWTARMAEDARGMLDGGEPRVALAFSDAFARAQDKKRPVPALTAAEWAALEHAIDEHPEGPAPVLASRGLGMADHARLVRHWAKALATDEALADAYDEALSRLEEASR